VAAIEGRGSPDANQRYPDEPDGSGAADGEREVVALVGGVCRIPLPQLQGYGAPEFLVHQLTQDLGHPATRRNHTEMTVYAGKTLGESQ
jgi:hypothetical protein